MREVDLAIIGAGVAGLTAAAVAAEQGVEVLVIERMGAGGQVINVERIDGMPGFEDGISGFELGPELQERAEAAGAEFMLDSVLEIAVGREPVEGAARHVLRCEGETIAARAVLIACGSRRKKLHVPGEDKLEGRGVSHCASCDGPLFRDQAVCVVGGGDSAFSEAIVLAGFASQVRIVFREDEPHAKLALQQHVAQLPNVDLIHRATVIAIEGEAGVESVNVRRSSGDIAIPVQGAFVYAGLEADTAFLPAAIARDAQGRIETNEQLETSVAGIFAAGDVRSGARYLLAAAAEEGALAARSACHTLSLRA